MASPERRQSPAQSLLRLRGVTKSFGGTVALDNVDLAVSAGEVHALLGMNGSGKSTLVKVLSGFHKPESGHLEVGGTDIRWGDPTAINRAGLRFVHQDLGLLDSMSAVENIAIGRGFQTNTVGLIDWAQEKRLAEEVIEGLGYHFDVNTPVGALPPPDRVGVAIARGVQDWESEAARVLVLDEPTAAMPGDEVQRLFRVLRRLTARGMGIIFISHHLDEVEELSDTVTVLRDGEAEGPFSMTGIGSSELAHLMIGEALKAKGGNRPPRPADRDPAIEVRDLGGATLRSASFSVYRGETLGLAGLAGSGAEAVAGLIFGARQREGGAIKAGDADLIAGRPDIAVAAGLGFVPGDRKRAASFPNLTVMENMSAAGLKRYCTRLGLVRGPAEREVSAEWLARVDIRPRSLRPAFWTLSGGNQQKVILARWLRLRPAVLLLDEPTQGVDVSAKEQIYEILEGFSASGATIVFSSSDPDELSRLAHRVIAFRAGVIADELVEDAINPTSISHAVLGSERQET